MDVLYSVRAEEVLMRRVTPSVFGTYHKGKHVDLRYKYKTAKEQQMLLFGVHHY